MVDLTETIIRLNQVSFAYEGAEEKAVKGVSCEVRKGEFLSIIGHNGSGKSTLAKLLNGLLLPTEGSVEVAGVVTSDEEQIWQVRQTVGMVFQNPDNQFVAPTVEDDIAFGMENIGIPPSEMEARIIDALQKVNMSEFRTAEPNRLSGGQKQRVAIAGALAVRPAVLVLDEATAMLDPRGRKEVLEVVRRMNLEQGMTVIQITHYLEETLESDRILVMDGGALVGEGTPETIYQKVDWLRKLGLDVPFACDLQYRLRKKGFRFPVLNITGEGVLDSLWISD
ncbi:energy-coupling factor transporter ATPase [Aneurinibacillus thermoaerophilus]|uniref:Energy-coupling factor transport system ATP-binding protein n=1 Tax=Aneurinibacillus thermoaerophilus TaxID=143495 RepID=A0A1G8C3V8_ANETH|nr:energy-coupling factor transporter ATPase [Aneurinibacillus thermoaerophilus]MED0757518.1 energy-coupling factor transporter ATPase [Aneurinibacillus thermoaerophilus]MED0761833.1 energy-coupling factor transporter ATPase [Aneurinibacillus thermoaerophilus]SDH40082.1 energy-coupling factor transport system ATP-binding protein [Aneurinibacillus thermoaerophilus]